MAQIGSLVGLGAALGRVVAIASNQTQLGGRSTQTLEVEQVGGTPLPGATPAAGSLRPDLERPDAPNRANPVDTFRPQSPEEARQSRLGYNRDGLPNGSRADFLPDPETEQTSAEAQAKRELEAIDRAVKTEERRHAATAGAYGGAPQYQYTRGPDGQYYAIGGSVAVSAGGLSGDPGEAARAAGRVRAAAVSVSTPSSADYNAAGLANRVAGEAATALAASAYQKTEGFGGRAAATGAQFDFSA